MSPADVTPIGPRAHVERFAPDEKLIEQVEHLLALAKSGELRALATATVCADQLVAAGRCNWGFTLTTGTMFALSHAVMMLGDQWLGYCRGGTSAPPGR